MGQGQTKQQQQISQKYTLFKTISPGEYWVRKKNKSDELLLRILTFYVEDELFSYLKVLEKRKNVKNSHLLQLVQYSRMNEHNMCSSMFKIRIVVEHPFKTIRNQILQRTQCQPINYFSEDEMWSILYSCCHALYSLYINKFNHEALNSDQIYIDTSGIIKIADPVLVHTTKNYLTLMNQGSDKIRYISPELVNLVEDNNFYFYEKQKSDVFILAIIILEVGNLSTVRYYNPISKKFNFDVVITEINKLRERYSHKFCEIVEQMLIENLRTRPRLEDVINNIQKKTIYTASSGNTSRLSFDEYEQNAKKVVFSTSLPVQNRIVFSQRVSNPQPQIISQQINKPVIVIPKPSESNKYKVVGNESYIDKPDSQFSSIKLDQTKRVQIASNIVLTTSKYERVNASSFEKKDYVPITFQLPKIPTFEEYIKQNTLKKDKNQVKNDEQYQSVERQSKNIYDSSYTPYKDLIGLTQKKSSESKSSQRPKIIFGSSPEVINSQSRPNTSYVSQTQSSAFSLPNTIQESKTDQIKEKKESPMKPSFKKSKEYLKIDIQEQILERSMEESKHSPRQPIEKIQKKPSVEDKMASKFVVEDTKDGRYQGYTRNGQKDGIGRLIFPQGGYYEGKWKNDTMNGYGQLYYANNFLAYQGFWEDGKFHGEGKIYNDSSTNVENKQDITINYKDLNNIQQLWESYEGDFQEDSRSGKGTMTFVNGQKFSGTFVDDRADGEGTYYCNSGEIIRGIWRDNKFVDR